MSPTATYGNSNVTMGSACKDFAVLAGTYVSFGLEKSVIAKGSVGVSPGTDISGNYTLRNGTTEENTLLSIDAAKELAKMYNTGSTIACQNYFCTGDLSGQSLAPGVYCSASGKFSVGQMASVTLDAGNVSDASWVFQTTGNMTVGSDAVVVLKNGALASNVY